MWRQHTKLPERNVSLDYLLVMLYFLIFKLVEKEFGHLALHLVVPITRGPRTANREAKRRGLPGSARLKHADIRSAETGLKAAD